ncbi:MAG: hypothetical protein GWP15_03170 [Nitrospirae bacterium]|nr:hypothetical protein [Nitrospirota bacterium]
MSPYDESKLGSLKLPQPDHVEATHNPEIFAELSLELSSYIKPHVERMLQDALCPLAADQLIADARTALDGVIDNEELEGAVVLETCSLQDHLEQQGMLSTDLVTKEAEQVAMLIMSTWFSELCHERKRVIPLDKIWGTSDAAVDVCGRLNMTMAQIATLLSEFLVIHIEQKGGRFKLPNGLLAEISEGNLIVRES